MKRVRLADSEVNSLTNEFSSIVNKWKSKKTGDIADKFEMWKENLEKILEKYYKDVNLEELLVEVTPHTIFIDSQIKYMDVSIQIEQNRSLVNGSVYTDLLEYPLDENYPGDQLDTLSNNLVMWISESHFLGGVKG